MEQPQEIGNFPGTVMAVAMPTLGLRSKDRSRCWSQVRAWGWREPSWQEL